MSSEIERKFLLGELPPGLAGRSGEPISQGYLSDDEEEAEIRLRRAGPRTLLTVKTGAGEVREEVEVEIGGKLFEALWPLTEGRRLEKTRLREPLDGGLSAEVDVYGSSLEGLVIAEVEFGSREASRGFTPPSWLGTEVTGDARYANRQLASDGAPGGRQGNDGDSDGDKSGGGEKRESRAFRLKRGEGVAEGIRRLVRGRVAKVLEALEVEIEEDRANAVHSARKDLKKIRSVLRLLRPELGEDLYRAENRRYRAAGRALSGSRDAEVKVQTLLTLAQHSGERVPPASAAAWLELLETERDASEREQSGTDSGAVGEAIGAVSAGLKEIDAWPLDGSWRLVGPGLRRAYGRGREAMGRVADDPDPELVHEWRKRAKDLWYQLRLVRSAWPGPLGAGVEATHELTDLLGDHHDLTVLAADLQTRTTVGDRERLATLIAGRQAELIERALELGERIYAEKPKAFGRRIHAYWSAWR